MNIKPPTKAEQCAAHPTYQALQVPRANCLTCQRLYVHMQAHRRRMELIMKPFPQVRRISDGSAMTWSGTIVGDTFYHNGDEMLADLRRGLDGRVMAIAPHL